MQVAELVLEHNANPWISHIVLIFLGGICLAILLLVLWLVFRTMKRK